MSKAIKRLLATAFCAVFALSFCLFSSALSTNEYGLGLSVEGEESNSSATLSLKLKNSNGFDVNGVCIDLTVPEGLDLDKAKKGSDGYSVLVDTLTAGEVYENGFVFVSREAAPVLASPIEKSSIIPAVLITFAIIALIAFLAVHKKKAAALMLAVLMLVPCAGIFGVHAIGTENLKSFQLEETVSINGNDYPVIITVSYLANSAKNSYFDFDVNEDTYLNHVETVTRLTTDISGVAVANGSVKSVSYAVESRSTGDTVMGEAQLDGCDWSIEKLAFMPGENEITITAELYNGDKQTETYNINYDRGEIYRPDKSEIKEENGERYVENVINIYFENGVSDERMNEILSENSLVRIGEINGIFLVQARANTKNLEELEALCEKIQALDEVSLAVTEKIVELKLDSVPNDPWYHSAGYTEIWNETLPNGFNWSVEAIEAISAWKYEDYFGTAKVGIVDGGFKTNHEDYASGLINFPEAMYQTGNVANDHGTHVAGIVGATRNNGLGGSGLLSDVKIYAASYTVGNSSNSITNVIDAVTAEIECGATAVNLSLGLDNAYNGTYNPYENPYSDYKLASSAGPCAVALNQLLSQNKEFVIVQSAGNGTIDTRFTQYTTKRSDDASQNGLFCSVNPDHYIYTRYYGGLSKNAIQKVYNRIIVAGGVRNYTTQTNGAHFKMFYSLNEEKGTISLSNGGDRVDIYAPGYEIFSTITDTSFGGSVIRYAWMTGTSQAAPIVTAVAAMCFAINPEFTGEQVKNIICDDANSTHTAYDYSLIDAATGLDYHPFEGDGKVISMKLCAEAALRTVCGPANYRYFNTIKNAADKLNPNDYTNFEVVQSVLDGIGEDFYALYEFEQEKVTAKANELVDAMDKLEERGKADYTDVEKAKAEAAALNPSHYVDFSSVTNAVNAVVYGKYADEQAQVDLMAKNIRDAIAALEPLAKITSSDFNVTANNTEMLVVIPPDYVGDLAEYLSAGKLTVTHSPNSKGNYSTGSTITITDDNGKVSDKIYTVVTLGDIDGDAKADGEDAFIIGLYMNGMLSAETAAELICCDVDFNGVIDEEDFRMLERCGLFDDYISNLYQGADQ